MSILFSSPRSSPKAATFLPPSQRARHRERRGGGLWSKSVFFFAVSLLVAVDTGHASEHENRTAFRVCADPHYLPWSNEQGEGFENEIASMLAKSLDLPVEYTWFPQRMGFIRNTLRARNENGDYRCDVVMGLPAGYELAITTRPYYHSTYALVYIEGRGYDDIRTARDLLALTPDRRERLRFGLAERNPGTMWLSRYDLLDSIEVAYASQSGDPNERPGQREQEDLLAGKFDFTFMWGPIAGHFKRSNLDAPIVVIPMPSEPGMQMHFGISAGVRFGDRKRKEELQALLDRHAGEIEAILRKHEVPLVSDKEL